MNLRLIRNTYADDGIFGTLENPETNEVIACTLEHAYDSNAGDGSYSPKLQNGTYNCVRGTHKLTHSDPFETFEITGVPGHVGILFHSGNYNEDSDGCVLLGHQVLSRPGGKGDMIISSRNTFNKFMDLQKDINEFTLTVS